VHPGAVDRVQTISDAQQAVETCLAGYREAWVENKHLTATIHYRQVEPALRYRLVWDVRRALHSFGLNVGMRAGKCSLELHPRVGWDKGRALAHIRETAGLGDNVCMVFGDDSTDESMFRACSSDITVRVGPAAQTAARFSLADPAAVSNILEDSLELLTSYSSPLARAAV
jgi:trehalose 6-phosphate phosphatase